MSEPIKLTFLGEPQAQKRHRHFQFKGQGQVRTYDPSVKDKADFLSVIQKGAPDTPMLGPLQVDTTFFFGRPRSHYGTGSKASVLKPNAPTYHTGKPDRDNLDKFVLDSMKGIFYKDDSQVCTGIVTKLYSTNPRTEVVITQL